MGWSCFCMTNSYKDCWLLFNSLSTWHGVFQWSECLFVKHYPCLCSFITPIGLSPVEISQKGFDVLVVSLNTLSNKQEQLSYQKVETLQHSCTSLLWYDPINIFPLYYIHHFIWMRTSHTWWRAVSLFLMILIRVLHSWMPCVQQVNIPNNMWLRHGILEYRLVVTICHILLEMFEIFFIIPKMIISKVYKFVK